METRPLSFYDVNIFVDNAWLWSVHSVLGLKSLKYILYSLFTMVTACGLCMWFEIHFIFDLNLTAFWLVQAFIFLPYISDSDFVIGSVTMTTSPESTAWCWPVSHFICTYEVNLGSGAEPSHNHTFNHLSSLCTVYLVLNKLTMDPALQMKLYDSAGDLFESDYPPVMIFPQQSDHSQTS